MKESLRSLRSLLLVRFYIFLGSRYGTNHNSYPMFSLIRDVSGEGCDPIQYVKNIKVSHEDGVHLGALEDGLAL